MIQYREMTVLNDLQGLLMNVINSCKSTMPNWLGLIWGNCLETSVVPRKPDFLVVQELFVPERWRWREEVLEGWICLSGIAIGIQVLMAAFQVIPIYLVPEFRRQQERSFLPWDSSSFSVRSSSFYFVNAESGSDQKLHTKGRQLPDSQFRPFRGGSVNSSFPMCKRQYQFAL